MLLRIFQIQMHLHERVVKIYYISLILISDIIVYILDFNI